MTIIGSKEPQKVQSTKPQEKSSGTLGLYEKYGYRYIKDIVNYGNGKDRLYVKEIK